MYNLIQYWGIRFFTYAITKKKKKQSKHWPSKLHSFLIALTFLSLSLYINGSYDLCTESGLNHEENDLKTRRKSRSWLKPVTLAYTQPFDNLTHANLFKGSFKFSKHNHNRSCIVWLKSKRKKKFFFFLNKQNKIHGDQNNRLHSFSNFVFKRVPNTCLWFTLLQP